MHVVNFFVVLCRKRVVYWEGPSIREVRVYQQHRETEKDGCYHSTDIYSRVLFIYQIEEVYTVERHVKTNIMCTLQPSLILLVS